jgi:hypothetical protein
MIAILIVLAVIYKKFDWQIDNQTGKTNTLY